MPAPGRSRSELRSLERLGLDPVKLDAAWDRAELKVTTENEQLRAIGIEPNAYGTLDELKSAVESKTGGVSLSIVGTTGRPAYPRQSIANWTEEGYRRNELVFACIAYLAKAGSEVTLRAAQRKISGPGYDLVDHDHPLNLLVRQPRPRTSEAWHLAEMTTLERVTGNAILWKRRGSANLPVELYWLRSDRVKRETDGNDQITRYAYVVAGAEYPVDVLDVIHHRSAFDPADPSWGLSPLAVMSRAVTVDNTATDFVASFFANAAVPYGLLTTDRVLSTPEARELENRWSERYAGMEGWNKPAVLGSGARYERLGLNMTEMAMPELRNHSETRIAMDLGIPPILVGAKVGLDRSTFSNYAEARESFWEETSQPHWNGWADSMTAGVAVEWGDRMFYVVDYSAVSALAAKAAARLDRAIKAWDSGMVTLDQANDMAGLPTLGGEVGKLRKIAGMHVLLSAADLKREASPDDEPAPAPPVVALLPPPGDEALESDEDVDDAPTPIGRRARAPEAAAATPPAAEKARNTRAAGREFHRQVKALRNAYVRTATGRLEAYVEALGDRVVSRAQQTRRILTADAAAKANPDVEIDETKALAEADRAAARRLLRQTDTRELERILSAYFDQIGADTVRVGNLVYDLGVLYGDSPARLATLGRAARASTQIVDTMTDDVGRAIAKANRRGWSITQLVDGDAKHAGIRGVFGKGDPTLPGFHDGIARAGRIAEASFTTAANVSAAGAFAEAGITEVEILDGSGLGDACDEINGSIWTVEQYAANELEHPNCTRIGIPVVEAPPAAGV